MIYLPKPEQAWQLLSDHQKKLHPLEVVLSDIKKDKEKYPTPNVVYIDVYYFRVWDTSRYDYMEVL